jgi:hypothetical protein
MDWLRVKTEERELLSAEIYGPSIWFHFSEHFRLTAFI